jgi:hypothetical protein
MTLREKIILFGICLKHSHPSTTQIWLEDVNLQKWYRGDIIEPDESMVNLGTQAVNVLVFFYLQMVLTSKNFQVIAAFLKENDRIPAIISNLSWEEMSQLFTQLCQHFPDLTPNMNSTSIPEAIYHILNCLSQAPKNISSSKKRKTNDSLSNLSSNENSEQPSPPKAIESSLKIRRFFTVLGKSHNIASQLWQDNENLRHWFMGLPVVINNKTYIATKTQLQHQFKELIGYGHWAIVSFTATHLASKFKNLEITSSLELLNSLIQHFDHNKLRFYLNTNMHSLTCVSQCLQSLRENKGIDSRIIAALECYLRKNGFHQNKAEPSVSTETKRPITASTYKKIKVLTDKSLNSSTPPTPSSSPTDTKQPQSPFFLSNINEDLSASLETAKPDSPSIDINSFFQNC